MKKLSLKELNRLSVEDFKQSPKTPMVLVLDNIRSALNVGSAFRTADAFALQKIYLCGITAQPPHREILKTAIGATDSVEWSYHSQTKEAVQLLRAEQYQIIAVEQAQESIQLAAFPVQAGGKYALVFGNEVNGVSQEVMDILDHCIEIPQYGTKHSLNVSVCLGIVVWDLFRKLNLSPH
ncbi:MAG: RNA methyltransferase [Bacteroidota bacterium]